MDVAIAACENMTMLIRINKCDDPGAWYAKHVGQVLPVERVEINRHASQGIPEDVYWCREGGTYNAINYVLKSDATEVKSMPEPKPIKPDEDQLAAMNATLKPCPFCGSPSVMDWTPVPDFSRKSDKPSSIAWAVRCTAVGSRCPMGNHWLCSTGPSAAAAWNRRT